VFIVNNELDLRLISDELHMMPTEIIQLEVKGRGHLALASSEIDMNLKAENANKIIRR